ncbi:MAG: aminoglycoside phosphotransferase family protein [Bdellovibrionales bacterium]|nr:aminoglycoside phosphotransferase family protein [Bdellovibrionales bacterium]
MRRIEPVSKEALDSLGAIWGNFALEGELSRAERLYQGHLHSTYIGVRKIAGSSREVRYIHQRINTTAFERTEWMLENTAKIASFIKSHPENTFPASLSVVETKSGEPYLLGNGEFWRSYEFVEDSISYDICPNVEKAFQLGRATGEFLFLLKDFPVAELQDHSPGFQDTVVRWEQLEHALATADSERREIGEPVVREFASMLEQTSRVSAALSAGSIPQQIVHGDTKINNFLFRENSDEVLCLVDIDLCMKGSVLYDIGDLIRSASAVGREDEPNLEKVGVDNATVLAIVKGFLESRLTLTTRERELLPDAGCTISFNLSTRFLADFLAGDRYFPVLHPQHNLERALAQWKVTKGLFDSRALIVPLVDG